MTSLLNRERCVACRSDSLHVTDQEAAELHSQIPAWQIVGQSEFPKLQRMFRFVDFSDAIAFTNTVGAQAEFEGHHPRLVTEWGWVTVEWWTHKIKGLHRNDFIMAAKTDQMYNN
jgi:4a-hydroxytetrahydrobiopterin dehydratase